MDKTQRTSRDTSPPQKQAGARDTRYRIRLLIESEFPELHLPRHSFAPPVTVDAVRIESPRVFHARTERGQRFLAAAYRRYGKRIPRAWIEIVRRFEVLHFGRAACAAKMRNLEYRWRRREY